MPNEGGEGKQNRHFEGELMKNIPPPPPLAPVNRRIKQNRHGWGFPIVFYVSSHFQVSQHALMTQAPGSEHKRLENINVFYRTQVRSLAMLVSDPLTHWLTPV